MRRVLGIRHRYQAAAQAGTQDARKFPADPDGAAEIVLSRLERAEPARTMAKAPMPQELQSDGQKPALRRQTG